MADVGSMSDHRAIADAPHPKGKAEVLNCSFFHQRSVTLTSRIAITRTKVPIELTPCVGDPADFVMLHERETLQSAVLDPPFMV